MYYKNHDHLRDKTFIDTSYTSHDFSCFRDSIFDFEFAGYNHLKEIIISDDIKSLPTT